MKIRLLSSFNLLPGAAPWSQLEKLATLEFQPVGQWATDLLNTENKSADALVCILRLEDVLATDWEFLLSPIRSFLTTHPTIPLVLLWFHDSPVSPIARVRKKSSQAVMSSELGNQLRALQPSHPNFYALPLDEFLAERGSDLCFDSRNFYAARCPFSFQGLDVVARVAGSVLHRLVSPAKKVLVLDLDNTLWGGVVGEVGIEGLVLGTDGIGFAFQQFQMKLLELQRNGILLAIASKNNNQDAWNVFDHHEGMVLKREHFAAVRINWKEKSESIQEIAEELSLGLDSFVFGTITRWKERRSSNSFRA